MRLTAASYHVIAHVIALRRMKLQITLKQYEDIYKIVASVAHYFSHGAGRSCQFYNVNGAIVLNKMLNISARPVMGAAFLRLNKNGDTISFAGQENDTFYSDPKAFHCWIETPSHFIDFTAPEYREAAQGLFDKIIIPRQMFQKSKSTMSSAPYSMTKAGDYFFSENIELTNYLLSKMLSIPATHDLAYICCNWYMDYIKNGIEAKSIMNDLGEITRMTLKSSPLRNKW